jgi:hypothetical protein
VHRDIYMLYVLPQNMKVYVYFHHVLLHHTHCFQESLKLSLYVYFSHIIYVTCSVMLKKSNL